MDRPVSVLDFGADPTGRKDSSKAFAAAAAISRRVIAPAGTYFMAQSVSVRDFGAIGEGRTKNADQIPPAPAPTPTPPPKEPPKPTDNPKPR